MTPPTYRERLRTEGAALAAVGAAGSALLLATKPQARRWPFNTAIQLLAMALWTRRGAPRKTRAALERAQPLVPGAEGSGEPTPLWLLPPIVAALCVPVVAPPPLAPPLDRFGPLVKLRTRAGWDGGLRVTAGSALAGLSQAVLLARLVAAEEARTGRTYYRVTGSTLLGGTKLGYVERDAVPPQS